jgi:tetratricopeptide (TPR) repeat protein
MRSLPGTINGLQVKQACLTHQGKLPYRQAVNNLELHPRTKRYVQICRRSLWLESLLWGGGGGAGAPPPPPPRTLGVTLGIFGAAYLALAHGDEEQLSAVAQLIQEADAKTRTAESVEDYTAILEICEEAGQHELSEVQRDYFNQLTAWASNRRGEQYAALAAEAATQGDDQQAAELDQLALADFETAVEFNPQRWKAIHNRGVSYALAGRYEDAIRDFSRVIELEPNYPNVWFNRGQIHYELGAFQEAVDDYNRMLQLSPQDAGAITNRAHARFELGQYREALQDYSRAVQLNPNSARALADRGDAYRALGDHPRAALDYRRAMQLADADSRVYQSAAWFMAPSIRPR